MNSVTITHTHIHPPTHTHTHTHTYTHTQIYTQIDNFLSNQEATAIIVLAEPRFVASKCVLLYSLLCIPYSSCFSLRIQCHRLNSLILPSALSASQVRSRGFRKHTSHFIICYSGADRQRSVAGGKFARIYTSATTNGRAYNLTLRYTSIDEQPRIQ
jgi:hypothetical protein